MPPTLLVLAAGMGSRYGGLKQIDPVGPSGETVLDYGVFDAVRAGFGRVVFVIRREFEAEFRAAVAVKYSGRIAVDFVFQSLESLPAGFSVPAGREKPWGTGHAVWCARAAMDGPFAVINADDFYGAPAPAREARRTTSRGRPAGPVRDGGIPPQQDTLGKWHRFARHLPRKGRAARFNRGGGARSPVEDRRRPPLRGGRDRLDEFMGFHARSLPGPRRGAARILAGAGSDPKAEFYLPAAVSALIAQGTASVSVLASDDSWFGITYKDDKQHVVEAVAALVRSGAYPARLFG